MSVVLVVVQSGQSNVDYPNRGELGTLPAVRFYYDSYGTTDNSGGLFIDLKGATVNSGGPAFTIGRVLNAAGYKVAIIDLTAGSTSYPEWEPLEPAADEGRALITSFDVALSLLRAEFPAASAFRFVHVRNQGTTDMRVNNSQYQTGSPPGTYHGWAAGAEIWHDALRARMAAAGFGSTLARICVQAYTGLSSAFFTPAVERQQLTWVGGTPSADTSQVGTHPDLIPLEDPAAYDPDGVHMKVGPATIGGTAYSGGGFHWGGTRIAARIQEKFPMGTLATFAKDTLNNHLRNKATYGPAATHYCAAFVGGVEVTGNGYARASRTNNTTTWPNASSRSKSSGDAFTFPTASGGAWGTIDEVRIYDAPSGGNELARHTLSLAVPITATKTLVIAAGAITISAPAGGFVDSVAHGLLNLMFGGTAYAQLVTTYGSYWAGDPQGAGAQAGSRVAITQATAWAASAAGRSVTAADISLADQATGTYWAEHDAAAAGNLLCSALLPAVPSGGKVAAGRLLTTLT